MILDRLLQLVTVLRLKHSQTDINTESTWTNASEASDQVQSSCWRQSKFSINSLGFEITVPSESENSKTPSIEGPAYLVKLSFLNLNILNLQRRKNWFLFLSGFRLLHRLVEIFNEDIISECSVNSFWVHVQILTTRSKDSQFFRLKSVNLEWVMKTFWSQDGAFATEISIFRRLPLDFRIFGNQKF